MRYSSEVQRKGSIFIVELPLYAEVTYTVLYSVRLRFCFYCSVLSYIFRIDTTCTVLFFECYILFTCNAYTLYHLTFLD